MAPCVDFTEVQLHIRKDGNFLTPFVTGNLRRDVALSTRDTAWQYPFGIALKIVCVAHSLASAKDILT